MSAVIYISFFALIAIAYLKLAFGEIIPKKEFNLWVISWFVVTYLAFFTYNFLAFIFLSAVFIFIVSKQTEDKLALFLILLFAIPSYKEKVSVLFTISFARELSLILLFPLLTRLLKTKYTPGLKKFGKIGSDKLIILYLGIVVSFYFRGLYAPVDPTTFSEGIRYGIYIFLEIFLPYYVASRYIKDFEQLTKIMLAFISICAIVGSIGVIEVAKSWLLYGDLNELLGVQHAIKTYLNRGGMIRASSSLDHSLILGMVMLIAIGFYIYISNLVQSKLLRMAGFALLILGFLSPLARGAWVGAFIMLIVYFSIGKEKYRNITIIFLAAWFSIPLLAVIPGGQKVLDLLPFIGTVDKMNVDYRSQLIEQSMLVIKKYPLFGTWDPIAEPEMQSLIQGEGIIDLVNYYIQITLYFGLLGLSALVGFFASVLMPLYKHVQKFKNQTSLEYICGKSLLALFVGVLMTISTISALNMINTVLFFFAGLIVSYIRVTKNIREESEEEFPPNEQKSESGQYPTSRVVQKTQQHATSSVQRLLR